MQNTQDHYDRHTGCESNIHDRHLQIGLTTPSRLPPTITREFVFSAKFSEILNFLVTFCLFSGHVVDAGNCSAHVIWVLMWQISWGKCPGKKLGISNVLFIYARRYGNVIKIIAYIVFLVFQGISSVRVP